MRCVIPGGNVKVLAKAVHMLSKIGDEVYVVPQEESISFRTVNMAKSAYSDFTFHKNFFSYYTFGDLQEEDMQKCKISMRSAMTVFKSPHTLDKQVETCHISLEVDGCNLIFTLKYKNGVNKSHLLPILESEKLQASYSKAGMTNELTSRARTLMDALQNFQQNLIEITLEVTSQKLLLRNYIDDESDMINTTRTQLALGVGEFERYTVGNQTVITFCLKEFRALLTFSESVGVPVTAHFETAGRPVLFFLKNQSFEAYLLLSTLNLDGDSQSDITVNSRKQMQSVRKKPASKNSIKRDSKSSSRTKKSISSAKPAVDNTCRNRGAEENQADKTANLAENVSTNVAFVEANDLINSAEERNQNKLEQNRLFALSPAATSSTTRKNVPENQRELVNSIFSSITKRKSVSNEDRADEIEFVNFDKNVSCSPSRQVAKKARLVFQKCFQKTFDERMLPGHDIILVDNSSDENNSD